MCFNIIRNDRAVVLLCLCLANNVEEHSYDELADYRLKMGSQERFSLF